MGVTSVLVACFMAAIPGPVFEPDTARASLRGEVRDAGTGEPIAVRIYIQSQDGRWHFPRSAAEEGSAVEYRKERQGASVEMHTTLSAHPFTADLPPGRYNITVERGKEYLPVVREVTIGQDPVDLRIELRRWTNMARLGWYSGDTHVHRSIAELPNVMLAEDLNVALPLSYWVTTADTPPSSGDKNTGENLRPEPIAVDATHVIYPVNTEYEIFRVGERQHTLGAVFILGHQTAFQDGVPPVGPVAERARREGAILDLDKHSWPWSLMLVPVMKVDLFELANNHVWRTAFGYRTWTIDTLPEYMNVERDPEGFTEWGWIDFGFQTYYALLNCGFRMRPTGGTASGVHPVPLGFGRVYVHLPGGFDYGEWMAGLRAGRSFVTTGPMLTVEVDGKAGGGCSPAADAGPNHHVIGIAESALPLDRIEIIVNGLVEKVMTPLNIETGAGGYKSPIEEMIPLEGSGWIALRCFERRPDGRVRFAHSSPVHIDVPGKPLRPRREEVEYLVRRMREEIARNQGILSEPALDEFREALRVYSHLLSLCSETGA